MLLRCKFRFPTAQDPYRLQLTADARGRRQKGRREVLRVIKVRALSKAADIYRSYRYWKYRQIFKFKKEMSGAPLDFYEFYRNLPEKKNVFYMFFTSGLLHWVVKALEFVPRSINVALIGSELTADEVKWIRANIADRPFHCIPVRVSDMHVWDFLLRMNEYHFGWLDIDCFVVQPEIFHEMAAIADNVAINCTWSKPPTDLFPWDVLCTAFLFINVDVFKAVEAQGYSISAWADSRHERVFRRSRAKEMRLLREFMPMDGDDVWCDTLVRYQLIANALGFRLNRVRDLRGTWPWDPTWGYFYSDELIHAGQVSSSQVCRKPWPEWYSILMQANYLLLRHVYQSYRLPSQYSETEQRLKANAEGCFDVQRSAQTVRRFLEQRGCSTKLIASDAFEWVRG